MAVLTVSIASANNRKLIVECLKSIYETADGLEIETYVVLNASEDDSEAAIRESFPQVKLIINGEKLGFTHNHNMVARRAAGKYVLVLNDDTVILEGALKGMVDFMEAYPNVGVLGCRILNPDLSVQWSCGRSFSHKFEYFKAGVLASFLPFLRKNGIDETREASWVTGACFLVRAEAASQVGLFDENIVIYFEDGDWCYRMIRSGWKVMFYPGASIIHYHGQTRKQHLARDIFIIYQSRLYFFSKHYGWLTQLAVRALTASEIAARSLKELALSILTRNQRARRLELLGAYGRVMRMTFGQGA